MAEVIDLARARKQKIFTAGAAALDRIMEHGVGVEHTTEQEWAELAKLWGQELYETAAIQHNGGYDKALPPELAVKELDPVPGFFQLKMLLQHRIV